MSETIYISYRRDDSSYAAGRLFDSLNHRLGSSKVFMDVDSILPGMDFVDAIKEAVASCELMLVIIGPSWLLITDHEGHRRIDDPNDFVRLEISSALEQKIPIITVLIDKAPEPPINKLPDDLKGLGKLEAFPVSHAAFKFDFERLMSAIEYTLENPIVAQDISSRNVNEGDELIQLRRTKTEQWAIEAMRVAEEKRRSLTENDDDYSAAKRVIAELFESKISARNLRIPISVFVSYSRLDSEFVNNFVNDLVEYGLNVWVDTNIKGGERWEQSIQRALDQSEYCVVVLSPNSVASDNVLDEVSFALDEKKKMIPLLYRTCEIPFRLRRLQWVDFRENYEQGMLRLLDAFI